jgi:hypothetical protein
LAEISIKHYFLITLHPDPSPLSLAELLLDTVVVLGVLTGSSSLSDSGLASIGTALVLVFIIGWM